MTSTSKDALEVISYRQYRELIKDGDVFLYKGRGPIAWVIQKVTRSPYSHVGIAAWWNSRLMVLEAVGKGVVASPLSENLRRYHGGVDYYWCATKISTADRLKMLDFAQKELGKDYNLIKVFLLGLRDFLGLRSRNTPDEINRPVRRYFCSEYVTRTFLAAGVDLRIGRSTDRATPAAIAKSPALQIKGILKVMKDD